MLFSLLSSYILETAWLNCNERLQFNAAVHVVHVSSKLLDETHTLLYASSSIRCSSHAQRIEKARGKNRLFCETILIENSNDRVVSPLPTTSRPCSIACTAREYLVRLGARCLSYAEITVHLKSRIYDECEYGFSWHRIAPRYFRINVARHTSGFRSTSTVLPSAVPSLFLSG